MSETLLSPDGLPLVTPEELEQGPSIPPGSDNDPTTVLRLCEYEEESQAGCRRTRTILSLEAEYDTFVSPEMFWGYWDQFCQHEGNIYYNKQFIETVISLDAAQLESDRQLAQELPKIDAIFQFLGYDLHVPFTVDRVYSFFRNPPTGFPALITETPQFFQCEDVGQTTITIDQLDRPLLTKIQSRFAGNNNPLLTDLANSLYVFNDEIFCTDYTAYSENANAKLGVLMLPTESTKYKVGNAYFFPFAPLTPEQKTFITNLVSLGLEAPGELVFVNL